MGWFSDGSFLGREVFRMVGILGILSDLVVSIAEVEAAAGVVEVGLGYFCWCIDNFLSELHWPYHFDVGYMLMLLLLMGCSGMDDG